MGEIESVGVGRGYQHGVFSENIRYLENQAKKLRKLSKFLPRSDVY